jgi:hypothetical protein
MRYDSQEIEPIILTIRGKRVVLDMELARIYGVTTKVFNQAVKRNMRKFPPDFMFRLTLEEYENLRSQIVTSRFTPNRSQIVPGSHGGRRYLPWVVPQFKFADKRIDLVVQGQKAQLALECDGDFWHGKDEFVADMERQRKLERCGWQFFRIRGSCYYATPEKALEPLWVQLEKMGIRSVTEESTIGVPEHGQRVDQEDNDDGEEQTILEEFSEEEDLEPDDVSEEGVERGGEYQEIHPGQETLPQSIYEALRVKSHVFGRIVIEILRERPNNSCMRESMPTYILKRWNIKTRGFPRKQFSKKVDDYLAVMARKGYITIYKSKNIRIKLGWVPYPGYG